MRALFALLIVLASCAPKPTLNQNADTLLYVSLSGDVILETPRPISFADVRLAADSVGGPYLTSAVRSVFGYYRLELPEGGVYETCVRIPVENPTSGWAGVTLQGDDFSESADLQLTPRQAPPGC